MLAQKTMRAVGVASLSLLLLGALTGCPLLFTGNQTGQVSIGLAPATGPAPLLVVFHGKAVLAPPYEVQTWTWDFGDGSAGEGQILTHCYQTPGTYAATLTVLAAAPKFRGEGDAPPVTLTATRTVTVLVANEPPVADAGDDQSVFLDVSVVSLDGSGSSDPDGDPITYAWTLLSAPAGSEAALVGADTVSPSFTPDRKGDYTFQLIVNDGNFDSAPDTVVVTVENRPPVADAGEDQALFLGTIVALDGSGSSDPDSDPLTYAWSFVTVPAGSEAVLAGANTVGPTFTPDLKGDYVIQLVVNDGTDNSAPDTVLVSIMNRPPVADAGDDQTVFVDTLVTLDGSGSSDPDADPLTYDWWFVATPGGSAAVLTGADTVSPTFTPDLKGEYEIGLRVNDGTVDSLPDSMIVTVPNRPPTAVAVVQPGGQSSATAGREAGPLEWNLDTLYALPRSAYGPQKGFWVDYPLVQLDPDTAARLGDVEITIILDGGGYLLPLMVEGGRGLAVDPTTGVMWALLDFYNVNEFAPAYHALARLNPYTGVATVVGNPVTLPLSELYAGLAVDEQSILYGITGNQVERAEKAADAIHSLYTIDTVTTVDDFVFQYPEPDPIYRTPGEVVAFNTDDGLMYHATGGFMGADTRLFRSLNLDTFDLTTLTMPVSDDARWNRPTAMTYAPGTDQFYLADVASEQPLLFRITLDTATAATEQYIGEIFIDDLGYFQPPIKGLAFLYEPTFTAPVVTLDGSQSSDPDGDPLMYAWSFIDVPAGSALTDADLSDPDGVTTSFTPDVLGTYVVQLIVNDGEVDSDPDTATVEFVNAPPVADAGADQFVPQLAYPSPYLRVQLNGDASYDPDGTELTFEWTVTSVPAGSSFDDSWFDPGYAAPSLEVDVASDTEPYVFQLTVTDADGLSSTDTVEVIVEVPVFNN